VYLQHLSGCATQEGGKCDCGCYQAATELGALENKLALLTNEVVQRREASKLVLDKFTYFDTTIAQLRTDLAEAIRVIEIYARRHGYTLATEQLLSRIKSKV
jgi:hypothetical protein